ncbi:universal stress protein [Streptomyces physcomitrii]|uniref:universal stress protein n=1 Tax=Streptomyces physcomitrii TaxID=2724184 RepID=UPI0033CAD07A
MDRRMSPHPEPGSVPELGGVTVGVDGSPASRAAALWAAQEADHRARPLHIVHAADIDRRALWTAADTVREMREEAWALLSETADAVRERFAGLVVTKELSRQPPVSGLTAAVGRRGTLVVGSRGRGGFPGLSLGSVALGVLSRAEVPVVAVPDDTVRPESGSVTAAVHDAADLDWLPLAVAEAASRAAVLALVSVWNVLSHVGGVASMLDDLGEIAGRHAREIAELQAQVGALCSDLPVSHRIEKGSSTAGILVEASEDTDLLVLGRHHPPLGMGRSLGHVAHTLLHHTRCPLMVVPPGFVTEESRHALSGARR